MIRGEQSESLVSGERKCLNMRMSVANRMVKYDEVHYREP